MEVSKKGSIKYAIIKNSNQRGKGEIKEAHAAAQKAYKQSKKNEKGHTQKGKERVIMKERQRQETQNCKD